MQLTIENLTKANQEFVATEWANPFNGLIQKLDAPMPDGALYLPLDSTGAKAIQETGELRVGESPFLMVVGDYPCLAESEEGCHEEYTEVQGFAIQYFSQAIPGMMNGYETYATWEQLLASLDAEQQSSEGWYAAPRAW